ncbi:hypothetical protein [Bradyrhizobium sp. ISRA463]|uniref:hypothetical protein n=1 Tax=Bradyrhizobium sp. ISRA463 TaxID=2866199 RepID=UPI002479E4E2|nr:hypothetical protein [Bradyrhizobium sp. ISRA463]WGS21108.1 hypothetical protein MTX22_04910 [Bradyrhizobium sp. ISRA463]
MLEGDMPAISFTHICSSLSTLRGSSIAGFGTHCELDPLRGVMSETIFNIFLPFKDERCGHALYVAHEFAGDDEAGVRFLQNCIDDDLKVATRIDLPRTFTRSEYYSHCRLGRGHELYDQIFQKEGAGKAPLFVTSLVCNGRVMVNATVHHHDTHFYLTPQTIGDATMDDWLIKYTREEGIDLPQLIHDDFFWRSSSPLTRAFTSLLPSCWSHALIASPISSLATRATSNLSCDGCPPTPTYQLSGSHRRSFGSSATVFST